MGLRGLAGAFGSITRRSFHCSDLGFRAQGPIFCSYRIQKLVLPTRGAKGSRRTRSRTHSAICRGGCLKQEVKVCQTNRSK